MNTFYLTGNEPLVGKIARAAFPGYTGKKFKIQARETVDVRSSWSGGSRDYFAFVQVTDGGVVPGYEVPQQSAFDRPLAGADAVRLDSVPGLVCVCHTIFQGKDMGITIIVHPSMMAQNMFPVATPELSEDEKDVLKVTCERKASYGGVSRRESIGMRQEAWDTASASLLAKGMIQRNGAVTPAGRNAHASIRGY